MASALGPAGSRYALSTLKLGVVLLGFTALAGLWEVLAAQVPGSPLYIGILPGPIGALRGLALTLALLSMAAGALLGIAFGDRAQTPRAAATVAVLWIGALLALAAQTYGAANGMHGHQMSDLRADARAVFFLRHGGLLLFALGWLDIGVRLLRRPPAT
jgi:hypothetical protein